MRTSTRRYLLVEHDGREYELQYLGPLAEWFEPLVTAVGDTLHVTYLAVDEDGGGWTDGPFADSEGAEFHLFDSGHDRDDWIDRHGDDPDIVAAREQGRFFWVERYEHGRVRYALMGESSAVDRQWDVAPACAYLILDTEWGGDLAQIARDLLNDYPARHSHAGVVVTEDHLRRLIDDAIRQHEIRVALWSGLAGGVLLAGTWHAILMCR
jgi:hypothetical protein